MSVSVDLDPKRKRVITYIILGVVAVSLMVIGLAVFRSAQDSIEGRRKAEQLQTSFAEAGLPVPSQDQLVRVLGTDGGPVCDHPTSALKQAQLKSQLANGAGGPGTRASLSDSDILQGEALAIAVYCPEQLPEFTKFVKSLNLDETRKK
jgi:hypothetical protein